MKKKILILAEYYIPSIKAGGPVKSINNMVENLSDKFEFYILANDRDLDDTEPFKSVEVDKWVKVGDSNVFYTNIKQLSIKKLIKLINETNCDCIYLNSFFSYKLSILIVILSSIKQISQNNIIVAPRGQFSEGALQLKKWKKYAYINIARVTKLYKNITWHATSNIEKEHIEGIFGNNVNIKVANNLIGKYKVYKYTRGIEKEKGKLRVIFISRIHPKKNLLKAIELFNGVVGEVEFDIYGPIEEKQYWEECKSCISRLPNNIKVKYKGIVSHNQIINIFKKYHIFLFPTLGENFGHVIAEAFISGCPVIISDRTPWLNLENKNVGWDIPLHNENEFIDKLQYCIELDNIEYQIISENCFKYGQIVLNSKEDIRDNYELLKVKKDD